jgi:hypothetical protein
MDPFELRDAFFKKIGVTPGARGYSDLEEKKIKIILVRGVPFSDIQLELVVDECLYIPPNENATPVVEDANMLYLSFPEGDIEGLEVYLKDKMSLHAQVLSLDPFFDYKRIHVIINDVDLGWFEYLEVI